MSKRQSEFDALAHVIALSTAKSDIESFCEWKWVKGIPGRWCDISTPKSEDALMVRNAVRYLDLKKMLERHPEHAEWVRVRTI